jgi:hypothetical protein
MAAGPKFTFRKHASIGAGAAEDDGRFLAACFVDTGDVSPLLDCDDPRRLILGRTGTGKSALLAHIRDATNALELNPHVLAFNHITNSTVLQFFMTAGVKLDLFFRLLWRHAFTVELLKWKYHINSEEESRSVFSRLWGLFAQDRSKQRALDYISQWGDKFWETTEYRIKELTTKIEDDLQGSIRTIIPPTDLSALAASKLSEEQKFEIVQRGQTIINSIQMKELTNVLKFLAEDVFSDPRQQVYVCIDRLDENWVDDQFRYFLIRSLIETIRDFFQVRNVKLIAVLRTDLLEQVFRLTRDSGFQEEKYRSLYLLIRWSSNQLLELLDRRIDYLVKQTYTKAPVTHKDLIAFKISKHPAIEYMLARTSMRPRELIEFFNCCIASAEGRATITKEVLFNAEGLYSKYRLRSLQDEWITEYPELIDFTYLLKKQPPSFSVDSLDLEQIADFCLSYALDNFDRSGPLSAAARAVAENRSQVEDFLRCLFYVFYRTGLVGLKNSSFEPTQWAFSQGSIVTLSSVRLTSRITVHPMYYRVLGISGKGSDQHESLAELQVNTADSK